MSTLARISHTYGQCLANLKIVFVQMNHLHLKCAMFKTLERLKNQILLSRSLFLCGILFALFIAVITSICRHWLECLRHLVFISIWRKRWIDFIEIVWINRQPTPYSDGCTEKWILSKSSFKWWKWHTHRNNNNNSSSINKTDKIKLVKPTVSEMPFKIHHINGKWLNKWMILLFADYYTGLLATGYILFDMWYKFMCDICAYIHLIYENFRFYNNPLPHMCCLNDCQQYFPFAVCPIKMDQPI